MINYKGSFVTKLFQAFEKNPDMDISDVLMSITHKSNFNGKHFFYTTDEQMYNSLENFVKVGLEEDEPLEEQAFEFWAEQQMIIKGK